MIPIEIYDPADFEKALELADFNDGGFKGPEDEKPRPAPIIRYGRRGLGPMRTLVRKMLYDPRRRLAPRQPAVDFVSLRTNYECLNIYKRKATAKSRS